MLARRPRPPPPAALFPAAQMLGTVATLMHDAYLPIYLTEELGLSHTKARRTRPACACLHALASAAVAACLFVGPRAAARGSRPALHRHQAARLPARCPTSPPNQPPPAAAGQPGGRGADALQGQRRRVGRAGRRGLPRPVGCASWICPAALKPAVLHTPPVLAAEGGRHCPAPFNSFSHPPCLPPAPSVSPPPFCRMLLLGAALTLANKPMYAAIGLVAALWGGAAATYWVFLCKACKGGFRQCRWLHCVHVPPGRVASMLHSPLPSVPPRPPRTPSTATPLPPAAPPAPTPLPLPFPL